MAENNGSLQKRITFAVLFGMSIILLSFGIVSYYIVYKNIEGLMSNKIVLARSLRQNVDDIIKDNINRLYDISISGSVYLEDGDFGPEKDALKRAYRYSIFTGGVFLLDKGGSVVLNYPERIMDASLNLLSIEPISRIIALKKPVVSNMYEVDPSKRKVLFILVPLKDRNDNYVGVAGGEIDPTNPRLSRRLRLGEAEQDAYIDIMDANGMIIASNDPSRIITICNHERFFGHAIDEKKEHVTTCHQCHVNGDKARKQANILTFVPLEMAPWGISIQEPRNVVFAPIEKLKFTFLTLGLVFIGTALLLTVGISRSIVTPIKELIKGTDHIAKGDLATPVAWQGRDEIGILGRSFETMRLKLVESMENIRRYNLELEERVRDRTMEIQESHARVERLLSQLISSQEEERKRIARGLHDATLQALSVILMRIDMCRLYPDRISLQKIEEIRALVLKTLDDVHAIIGDLRPSLLDDLGLEAAIKKLLETNFGGTPVNYFLDTRGTFEKKLRPRAEITIFRIIQEAISNIARHAVAENVFVSMRAHDDSIEVEIEDDGKGFDVQRCLEQREAESKDGSGLGLLGMNERVSHLNGTLRIFSAPGCGTRISLRFPAEAGREEIAQD